MKDEMILKVSADMQHDGHEIMVRKSNDLIQKSRFDLSVEQQRIVLFLISKISPQDDDFKLYDFSIPEFCMVCGIDHDNGGNYEYLKSVLKTLRDKSVGATLPDGRWTTLAWVEKPYISKKNGTVQIRLDRDMKPFLLELKERFTQYELIYTLNFKSKYTIRLYELIKSRHFHEMDEYTFGYAVEDLRQRMGADDRKSYAKYTNFKARALLPAVKEINDMSDIDVEWKEMPMVRRGVTPVAIQFAVRPKAALERMKIRDKIEHELGWDQIALW